ncbi:TonB-dependent receptor (plasmid) [Novosphingobium sp. P6W]|nr:TonB-dependent receptor [Novosphingobium sp. P6W]KIS31304.1 TonB-dependent receptor [Novosphingobium sp. P6W]
MRIISASALAIIPLCLPNAALARDIAIPRCTLAQAIAIIARGTGSSIGTTNPALLGRRIAPARVSGGVDTMLRQILGNGVVLRRISGDTWLIVGIRQLEVEPAAPAPILFLPESHGPSIVVAAPRQNHQGFALHAGTRTIPGTSFDAVAGLRGTQAIADRVALVTSTHQGPGRDKLFLRGIADSSFAGTRASTVAQYLGEQRLTYRAPDPGLLPYDLAEVEVSPGPQGALYGAGALGGVIRAHPRSPEIGETSLNLWSGYSGTAQGGPGTDFGAVINLPVGPEKLALRALGYRTSEGGYIDDTLRGLKDVNRVLTRGGRIAMRYKDGDWTGDAVLVGQKIRTHDAQYATSSPLERGVPIAEPAMDSFALGSATLRRDGENTHASVTVGTVRQDLEAVFAATSLDGRAIAFQQANRASLRTLEARVWHEPTSSHAVQLGWIAGMAVLSSRSAESREVLPTDPANRLRIRNHNTEINAFGEMSLHLSHGLIIGAALRASKITLDGDAFGKLDSFYFSREQAKIQVRRRETRLLPSLSASLDLGMGTRVIARYGTGYRPGGVSGGVVSRRFASDRISTLEVGLQNGRIGPFELDATLAWSHWSDVQADLLTPIGLTYTENIGEARVLSADVAIRAQITPRLTVGGAAMLVNDHLKAIDDLLDGNASLPNIPDINLRAQARYVLTMPRGRTLALDAAMVYEGISHLGSGANLNLRQGGTTRIDLASRFSIGRYSVTLSAENLLNARGNTFALGNPFTLRMVSQSTPQRPRTVRLGVEACF